MLLSELSQIVDGTWHGENISVNTVSIDSRHIKAGDTYLAIKGERFDGHDFIEQAQQAGAIAIISQQEIAINLPCLIVANTELALAQWAGAKRQQADIPIIGITGSNGKTTVKEMIATILSVNAKVLFTAGNLNNNLGVPLTLLRLAPSHQMAVIEMGANHQGEIAYSARYAQPNVAVITNVGAAHIEGFGSIDGVATAKAELIASLNSDGVAVLNADDAYFNYWQSLAGKRKTISFGLKNTADISANKIKTVLQASQFITHFDLLLNNTHIPIKMSLAGLHNVLNALAATAACLAIGIDIQQIQQGLATMQGVNGRFQPLISHQGSLVIDDSYNANPASLQVALETLQTLDKPLWVALGAFGELGGDSQQLHADMGQQLKTMGVKRLFAVGDDAKITVQNFGDGGLFFETQQQLIQSLNNKLMGEELLLVKGSRAQRMEEVARALVKNFRVQ